MGKTVRADRACSAGCVCPTSNPAARAARAVPTPTRIVLFGAARREIQLVELAIIVRIGRGDFHLRRAQASYSTRNQEPLFGSFGFFSTGRPPFSNLKEEYRSSGL